MRMLIIDIVLMTTILLFSSCNHKELCLGHPHMIDISLDFDWRNAPDANPAGMGVFFYPVNGGEPIRYNFTGTEGSKIRIPLGEYTLIAYNYDTEAILFDYVSDFSEHTGYTRQGSIGEMVDGYSASYIPQSKASDDEKVVISPDMLWGAYTLDIEISESGIKYRCVCEEDGNLLNHENDNHNLVVFPMELVCNYTYEVRNVSNLDHVEQMCGSLSGMSGALYFSSHELDDECVTIPFAAHSYGESKITGGFLTFGHHEEVEKPHIMMFYLWMDDGKKYYYEYDVTDQIHEAPDKRNVHIIIDGLDLPEPMPDDNMGVGMDDWITVEGEIIM